MKTYLHNNLKELAFSNRFRPTGKEDNNNNNNNNNDNNEILIKREPLVYTKVYRKIYIYHIG